MRSSMWSILKYVLPELWHRVLKFISNFAVRFRAFAQRYTQDSPCLRSQYVYVYLLVCDNHSSA